MLLAVLTLALLTGGPAEDDEFSARVAMLSPDTPRDERLAAVRWMIRQCARPAAVKAVPAIERCAKHDADAEVRYRAVEALGMIAYQQKPKVCPLAVAEALLDKDAEVRGITMGVTGMFREFAPGSVDVFLKCARHDDDNVRAISLSLLASAAPKDEKAVAAIRAGRDDPSVLVRHDAHVALFRATDKLDDFVAYCLRVRVEFLDEPDLDLKASDEAKQERVAKNLILLGVMTRLTELGEERPDGVAKAVLVGLDDKSAVMRRGAASYVGVVARRSVALPDDKSDPMLLVPDDALPDILKREKRPAVSTKLPSRLRESGIEDRLRKMRDDDPDRAVRDAAGAALKQLAAAKERKN